MRLWEPQKQPVVMAYEEPTEVNTNRFALVAGTYGARHWQ
jgi:hypothetical protein